MGWENGELFLFSGKKSSLINFLRTFFGSGKFFSNNAGRMQVRYDSRPCNFPLDKLLNAFVFNFHNGFFYSLIAHKDTCDASVFNILNIFGLNSNSDVYIFRIII